MKNLSKKSRYFYPILFLFTFLFSFYAFAQKQGDTYRLNINNINMPMNNKGVMADVNIPPDGSLGRFAGHGFLFSGGFYLSGYCNDTLFANAIATSSLEEDYIPGTVSSPNDPRAQLYKVDVQDVPFGQSWQDWKDAVDLGADFYDGDGDGQYNPVDLNNNGQWDPNEDKPIIWGDQTIWCVYNDGLPADQRRWDQSGPLGIEIRQTVFAFAQSGIEGNFIVIKYKIRNTGLVASTLDSVYFGVWSDPDIGNAWDDMVGSDIQLQSQFTYNNGPDDTYGNSPPAFFTPILSSTSNLQISSSCSLIGGDPLLTDPNNINDVRNYMLGLLRDGSEIDPCNWPYSEVRGNVDCDTLNNRTWYSGDPVINVGWIFNEPSDVRNILSIGPFTLTQNSDYEIVTAYAVGQGSDALSSVTAGRDVVDYIKNNVVVTDVKNQKDQIVNTFNLQQNFPNPFNPSTYINFSLQKSGNITLKVFDVLGREVQTLIDDYKNAGEHQITFNAQNLASGIYYYQLIQDNNIQTKKMMLIK